MGQLLRDCRVGGGRTARAAIRRDDADCRSARTTSGGRGFCFATPTIVHFCAVLFLAALLRAPWKTILPAALVWGL
jgi:hypothetical protein